VTGKIVIVLMLAFMVGIIGFHPGAAKSSTFVPSGITAIKNVESQKLKLNAKVPRYRSKDKDADYAGALMRTAVKIQEDVDIKNIKGSIRHIKSASSGSGVVIAVRNNKSLILTAAHVCISAAPVGRVVFKGKYIVTHSQKYVITTKGKKLRVIRIVKKEINNDVCIIETVGNAGNIASVAPDYPPMGARVHSVGAPAGYWQNGLPNIVEGRYVGIRTTPMFIRTNMSPLGFMMFVNFSQYSFPIVGGQSGSAIFYRGKIIGIATIGTSRYEHLVWGPGVLQLKSFVKDTLKKWK